MKMIIILSALSGGGKSEVFNYVKEKYPAFKTMKSYTSRPPRHEDEGGYVFKDKKYFENHIDEFVELETFPPGLSKDLPNVHYYGKHQSQFDGKNYITIFEEGGIRTIDKKNKADDLFGYKLITILLTCNDDVRLSRLNGDIKRFDRDKNRKLLSKEFYDYVVDNSGTKEHLYSQIDDVFSKLKLN